MDQQIIHLCELIKNVIHPDGKAVSENEINWSYMIQLSREHNLLPILLEEAVKYPTYISRPEYLKEMSEAFTIVGMQTKKTDAFLKLYKAFLEADLHPLVMKGLICRQLYGKLRDHRPSSDEDILIRISEYERAKEVLVANGYAAQMEVETKAQLEKLQEVTFIHPTEKLHIELHVNPMGREDDARSQMSDYFKDVFDNYLDISVEGVMVRTMNHQSHFVFLVLHTFKHFIGGGFGIRQMLDILLYMKEYGTEIDKVKLREALDRFKAYDFLSDMIHIGNAYLGFELEPLEEAKCPDELLEDMVLCGVFGNETEAQRAAERTVKFSTGNYLKKKKVNSFVMLWKTIFPNREYLLDNSPELEKKPWLLPVAWVKRWLRFLKRSRKSEGNLAAESMQISQRRMKLLKKYDLV